MFVTDDDTQTTICSRCHISIEVNFYPTKIRWDSRHEMEDASRMMNNNLRREHIILSYQPVEIRCQLHKISIITLKHLFVAVEPGSHERRTNRSKFLVCCMAMDPREKHREGLTRDVNQEGVRSMFFPYYHGFGAII